MSAWAYPSSLAPLLPSVPSLLLFETGHSTWTCLTRLLPEPPDRCPCFHFCSPRVSPPPWARGLLWKGEQVAGQESASGAVTVTARANSGFSAVARLLSDPAQVASLPPASISASVRLHAQGDTEPAVSGTWAAEAPTSHRDGGTDTADRWPSRDKGWEGSSGAWGQGREGRSCRKGQFASPMKSGNAFASLVSDGKESTCSAGHLGLIPGSGRSPGEGNGNPLQYSCLENPMDRGAWATVHAVAKSQMWLSD